MFKVRIGTANLYNHKVRWEIDRIQNEVLNDLNIVSISKLSYLYSQRNNFTNPITIGFIGAKIAIHPGKKRALIAKLTGRKFMPSVFVIATDRVRLQDYPFLDDAKPFDAPYLSNIYGSDIWTINAVGQESYAGADNEHSYNSAAQDFFRKHVAERYGNLEFVSRCGWTFKTELEGIDHTHTINIEQRDNMFTELFRLIDG